jgi:hypothetical protein
MGGNSSLDDSYGLTIGSSSPLTRNSLPPPSTWRRPTQCPIGLGEKLTFNAIACVADPPVLQLRLGATLREDDIKEGDDVYFECAVRANPPIRKIEWTQNVSNASHTLHQLTRHHLGHFSD